MINRIVEELNKTNQRLNKVKDIPMGNIEEKLTRQVELLKTKSLIFSLVQLFS